MSRATSAWHAGLRRGTCHVFVEGVIRNPGDRFPYATTHCPRVPALPAGCPPGAERALGGEADVLLVAGWREGVGADGDVAGIGGDADAAADAGAIDEVVRNGVVLDTPVEPRRKNYGIAILGSATPVRFSGTSRSCVVTMLCCAQRTPKSATRPPLIRGDGWRVCRIVERRWTPSVLTRSCDR
jgi:hypothetical protein